MRRTVAVGLVAGAVLGAVAVTPASADAVTGTVTITFSKKTWKAITAEMQVKPTGKAKKAGCIPIRDIYCTSQGTSTAVGKRTFTFPGMSYDQYTVASKGGLAFVRADASLKMKNFDADLANDVMAADIPGIGTNYDLFDMANVKQGNSYRAGLNLAMGEAATLNQALKTDIFRDGMRIGTWRYTHN